jgi:hypothetical protein
MGNSFEIKKQLSMVLAFDFTYSLFFFPVLDTGLFHWRPNSILFLGCIIGKP